MSRIVVYDPVTKKFTQIDNPQVKEKPLEVVLTEEEKNRVIDAFKDIMEREPDQEEIEELFSEEVKLKQAEAVIGVKAPLL